MNKKIVYGICGVGNGHIYRQIPIINYLLKQNNKIMFFAYGNSLDYLYKHYADNENVKITEVLVPYYIGNDKGLDFVRTKEINDIYFNINLNAFGEAQQWLGKPDLVISDYEPFAAQYGYAYSAKVLTIDQQSKYLLDCFPKELNGTSYQDEIMRLRMFFPLAERIACSFFKVRDNEEVLIIPPIIRKEIIDIVNVPKKDNYIVYLTAQKGLGQSIGEIINILSKRQERFHIFTKERLDCVFDNIKQYQHGDPIFEDLLKECSGIITTAGHSLISECVYLGIPIYAIPLKLYEQQLNAHMISENNCGVQSDVLTEEILDKFLNNIEFYRATLNITDKLFKQNGLSKICEKIEFYLSN